VKKVRDYYFTSDGTHNGDEVVIQFTDGSFHEGFWDVKPATENDLYVSELLTQKRRAKIEENKRIKREKIKTQFQEFLNQQIPYEDLAKMYFELKNKVKVDA